MINDDALRQLDEKLLAAHAAVNERDLVRLYREAAEWKEGSGDFDAACFYYTHAYVFALESGDIEAGQLHARLVSYGREYPEN